MKSLFVKLFLLFWKNKELMVMLTAGGFCFWVIIKRAADKLKNPGLDQ